MSDRRKRYCARCRSRLKRTALRCVWCGHYSLRGWPYTPLVLACAVVAAVLLVAALLSAGV